MSASLVGSEMCIRDRVTLVSFRYAFANAMRHRRSWQGFCVTATTFACLDRHEVVARKDYCGSGTGTT
eukprot:8386567-Alexandrium_andersonii.AAC.1